MRLLAAALLLAAPAGAQQKDAAIARPMGAEAVAAMTAAAPTETVRYGDAESQVVEFYAPDAAKFGDGPYPTVALIHGGCWRKSVAGRELLRPAAADLASRGYAVWSVGYRRIDEAGGGYPGTYADVGAALDKMVAEAEARKLDLKRLAFMGHSAGGHLALWATSRRKIAGPLHSDTAVQPKVAISLGGFGDVRNWADFIDPNCGPGTAAAIVGEKSDARPDVYADTSPFEALPTGVPVVMVQGIYDPVSFPAVGRSYAFRAQNRGDRAAVVLLPNAAHFEVIAPGTPAWATIVRVLDERMADK